MPGQNSVSFQAPQAPVSRWRVRIPQAGVKVNIFPLIAATEVPSAGRRARSWQRRQVRRARRARRPWCWPSSGRRPMVRIDWTPKAEGATGLAALVSVQAEQQVWINEGATRSRVNLTYTISRAELGQLAVEVPADYKVVNVFDANVRQWSVEPPAAGAKRQKITAQLFEPAKSVQQVIVELEKFAGDKRADLARRAGGQGPGRGPPAGDRGRPGGGRAAGRGHARPPACCRSTPANCPPRCGASPGPSPIAMPRCPTNLVLAIEEVQPRVTAESLVEARLEPERLTLDMTAVYNIERAGVFKLELDVPAGYARAPGPRLRPARRRRAAAVPCRSIRIIWKARRRTAWWSTWPARPSAAWPWRSNCRRTCRSRTCWRPPARRPTSRCRSRKCRRHRRAGHGPAADLRPGEPAGQPGQDRGAAQHLLQGGRRRHASRH